jgi:hypothetical protein
LARILYSATGADGQAVDGFVEAAGMAEARAQLQARGLRELRFHQEAMLATDEADLRGLSPKETARLAALMVRIRGNPGTATILIETARANRTWLVIDALLIPVLLWFGSPWMAALVAVIGLLPFAFALHGARRVNLYVDLLMANAIGDWDRSAALTEALRPAAQGNTQLAFDLDVRAAGARVRQGEPLEAVLPSLAPWRETLAGQPGLFESRVAAVHAAAGDRAGFVAAMRAACEGSNREPSRAMDLALAEARFGDVDAAQALLDAVDPSLLPMYAAPFLAWTRGAIAQRLGEPQALAAMTKAVTGFLQLAEKQPAVWVALAFCTADQALALQAVGRIGEARRNLQQVWPILEAHADVPLLQVLQREVRDRAGND